MEKIKIYTKFTKTYFCNKLNLYYKVCFFAKNATTKIEFLFKDQGGYTK